MAETPYAKYRLSPATLADVSALAASAGSHSQAIREAVAYWREAVETAGRENGKSLTPEEWTLLGHIGNPTDFDLPDEDCPTPCCRDWATLIGLNLVGMFEGRPILLKSQKEEQSAAKKLAKKIANWSLVRGYALMAALRYFWTHQEAGISACASPEIWLTPDVKE